MILLGGEGAALGTENGPIFINDATRDDEADLPNHFDLNRAMDEDSKREIMTTAALALVEQFEEALIHARLPGCIRRARDLQIRAMCDYCSTGIFASAFMCTICGGEYCLTCKKAMDTVSQSDLLQSQLSSCVKEKTLKGLASYQKGKYFHSSKNMIPVTRFTVEELQKEVKVMQEMVRENAYAQPLSMLQQKSDKVGDLSSYEALVDKELGSRRKKDDTEPIVIPSHLLVIEEKSTLDQEKFLATWAKGEPLVVINVYTQNTWDPNAFIDKYGHMECEIVRCDEQIPFMSRSDYLAKLKKSPSFLHKWAKSVPVRTFFESFGKPEEDRRLMMGDGVWKLKVSCLKLNVIGESM